MNKDMYENIEPVNKISRKRKINKYALDGTYLETFDSLVAASRSVPTGIPANIYNACSGRIKTAYGFMWRFAEEKNNIN